MKYDWNEAEIKSLFKLVEKFKNENKSLLDAFSEHAKNFNRKPLSVRNFYYQKCDEILNSQALQKKFDINIKLHQKNNFAKFDDRQTQKLINFIKNRISQGKSVRSACMELANNDAKLLVRLQNKYRSETQKSQNLQKNSTLTDKNSKNLKTIDNIISFPVEQKLLPQKLTDAEIQSLFLGLVNLIKKSTLASVEEKTMSEREKLSLAIRTTTVELEQKNDKIEKLLEENQKLSKQVLSLKDKLKELRMSFVEKINV